ncbi:hypothetical protein [Paramagnetospirillum magneticum]|uniref:DUF4258 domain-containing protein n=1 Tax=Paramagnetospirillum magneticum (strain ATCC 700264 / AMB-1) TaxID=342108 RepID=Q2W9M8_PARM1|nr:hypothetical protein [Paramagnetospirillum magneticum]BAE49447.1 hypothetical protein amb0643 [Paramagnetospirillum magneticum AMB-1]
MPFDLSTHTETRLRQRGIRNDHLSALLAYGGGTHSVGRGCESVWLRDIDLDEVITEFGRQFADRLRRLVAVTDTDTVVTVFCRRGRKARRHVRG